MLPTRLTIPQPCSESWDAMRPAPNGRHCAACQKTVVDFTLKTDAEILAYLAGAASTRTCGRFAAGQLDRPLQRAVPAAPTRWRAWLAAAVAVWGLRETASIVAPAQSSTEWRSQYWGGPAPAAPPAATTTNAAVPSAAQPTAQETTVSEAAAALALRGTVTDFATGESLPGCTIRIEGTEFGTSTNWEGQFELLVPPSLAGSREITLSASSVGYEHQQCTLVMDNPVPQSFRLQAAVMGMFDEAKMPPAPWKLRRLFHWGKYWLGRPFQR